MLFVTYTAFPVFSQVKGNPLMIGIRAGISSGLTVKKFFNSKFSNETILATRFKGYHLTSLIQWHKDLGTPKFSAFLGAGAHVSLINGKEVAWYHDEQQHIMPGFDINFGIEYYFSKLPLNFSIDWKPSVGFVGKTLKTIDGAGFSLRYYFSK